MNLIECVKMQIEIMPVPERLQLKEIMLTKDSFCPKVPLDLWVLRASHWLRSSLRKLTPVFRKLDHLEPVGISEPCRVSQGTQLIKLTIDTTKSGIHSTSRPPVHIHKPIYLKRRTVRNQAKTVIDPSNIMCTAMICHLMHGLMMQGVCVRGFLIAEL